METWEISTTAEHEITMIRKWVQRTPAATFERIDAQTVNVYIDNDQRAENDLDEMCESYGIKARLI